MIKVRQAGPDDGDALGEIHAAAWAAVYAPLCDPAYAARGVRERLSRWHGRIAAGDGTILVATLDDRPLALSYAAPSPDRPGFGLIHSFYGHPDGWGSGVAAALMTETLRRLHAAGLSRVHLWTLRDTPQSRRFYTKCGFTETGATRDIDYGPGNLLPQVEYAHGR